MPKLTHSPGAIVGYLHWRLRGQGLRKECHAALRKSDCIGGRRLDEYALNIASLL